MSYINISGYIFTDLTNLEDLQSNLKARCDLLQLKGTILLATEGMNVFLCGDAQAVKDFYAYLTELHFPPIAFKESPSSYCPFKRMLVKIKPEIITMGAPHVDPINKPAPRLSAERFKQWLDEEKPMIILDTRNDYEVEFGKFKNAIHLNIQHFSDFKTEVDHLPADYKNKTIVTYCTGGIRCEKAAPFLIEQGFADVYQLDGGILKYLEENGNAHYEGECFVFDQRIAVDCDLEQSSTIQCQVCQGPIWLEEQRATQDKSTCPNCYS